jgi:hypothetical protein
MQKEDAIFLNKKTLSIIVITPIIIGVILLYFIFGDLDEAFNKMLEFRGHPSKSADAFQSLSFVWSLLISVYGLFVSIIFSYLLWKVSKNSLQVSYDLKELEVSRDNEIIREHAIIVYYDLQQGFNYLRDIYISSILQKRNPNPKRVFFSEEWIKNTASLRNYISREDLSEIYRLYNEFYTIQDLLQEERDAGELNTFIEGMVKRVFADFFPDQLLDKFKAETAEDLLEINLFIMLQKIYYLTFLKREITQEKNNQELSIKINGVNHLFIKEGNPLLGTGKGIIYNQLGYPKAEGYFHSGIFLSGKVYGYFDSNTPLYIVKYETVSPVRRLTNFLLRDPLLNNNQEYYFKGELVQGKINDGIVTYFHKNGVVSYRGNIKNNLKDKKGVSFNENGHLTFDGTYKEGRKEKGNLYKNQKLYFSGEFKNDHPYNGKVFDYQINDEIKKFTGEIKAGRPFNGKGYTYSKNQFGETREEESLREEIYQYQYEEQLFDEEYEEWQSEDTNNYIRDNYNEYTEYIAAEWCKGEVNKAESKESNILIYYTENSK